MIDAENMIPLLVEASPSFAGTWTEFLVKWNGEPSLPYYLVLGDFARHMCGLMAAGDEQTLKRVFAAIERLHIEGSPYVKEATTIGLLEDLQNSNMHLPKKFEYYLHPESARWWGKVREFWEEGKVIAND